VLTGAPTPEEAVEILVRTARPHEAYRSISCVVADLTGEDATPRDPSGAAAD
jgi:hypothetical protein